MRGALLEPQRGRSFRMASERLLEMGEGAFDAGEGPDGDLPFDPLLALIEHRRAHGADDRIGIWTVHGRVQVSGSFIVYS